jgi:hypothetical protein
MELNLLLAFSHRFFFSILLYVRHSLPCLFRGDALPNYEDISIKVDLQNVDLNSR